MKSKNAFKIRKSGWGEYGLMDPKREEKYFNHIASMLEQWCRPSGYDELLAFFGHDFFMDGGIFAIEFLNKYSAVKVIINCPNIVYKSPKFGEHYVKDFSFECVFSNINSFKIWGADPYITDHSVSGLTFYRAEVDTLVSSLNQVSNEYSSAFRSLVILCNSGKSAIEIIFKHIDVKANCGIVWDSILNDDNYVLPAMPGINWP